MQLALDFTIFMKINCYSHHLLTRFPSTTYLSLYTMWKMGTQITLFLTFYFQKFILKLVTKNLILKYMHLETTNSKLNISYNPHHHTRMSYSLHSHNLISHIVIYIVDNVRVIFQCIIFQ